MHPIGGEWAIPDVDDLAKWMEYAYENKDEVKELGFKAREYAKKYSWEIVGKKWLDLVDKTLTNPRPVNYKGDVGV